MAIIKIEFKIDDQYMDDAPEMEIMAVLEPYLISIEGGDSLAQKLFDENDKEIGKVEVFRE